MRENLQFPANLFRFTKRRGRRSDVFCKKGVLKNFAKFTGKHLCQSLFFNKVTCLLLCNFIKKRLQHRCFPKNSANNSNDCFWKKLLHLVTCQTSKMKLLKRLKAAEILDVWLTSEYASEIVTGKQHLFCSVKTNILQKR